MSERPIAFIDLGGVLYDFVGGVKRGYGCTIDDTRPDLGLDPDVLRAIVHDHRTYGSVPADPDAVEAVRLLRRNFDGYLDHQTSAADDEAKRAAWAQRARQRAIPSSQRRAVFERDDWACRNCGAGENLEIDHIYPVARGGDNALDNLQVLCSPCNRSKGSSVPGERY